MPALPEDRGGAADRLLRRVEWTVLRRLDGAIHGNYRTLFRGFGIDLADLREYQFGDDVRHIDWNVTARTGTPHVRQFHEDREVAAWFLVDLSPSLGFGSGDKRKQEIAAEFVAAVGRLLTRTGNRVGAMFYGDRVEAVIPARSGRAQVLHILHRMEAPRTASTPGETDLGRFLADAFSFIPRRSLVFVVSDFISTPGWPEAMSRLTHRHEVLGVRLFDPLEQKLPDIGLVLVRDAETGEQLMVDTHEAGFRRRFAQLAAEREEAMRGAFADAGVDVLELSTGDDLVESVLRFADLRKRMSQLAGGGLPAHLKGAA
jgi:uncharacterized protein (DUF58 family)